MHVGKYTVQVYNIYMYVGVYAGMHVSVHEHMAVTGELHPCLHAYMYACMHAYLHTYLHTYIHARARAHTHTRTHACTRTHSLRVPRPRQALSSSECSLNAFVLEDVLLKRLSKIEAGFLEYRDHGGPQEVAISGGRGPSSWPARE